MNKINHLTINTNDTYVVTADMYAIFYLVLGVN